MVKMFIRKMETRDIDAVHLIDQASFNLPWRRETYEMELEENNFAVYFVVETEDGDIVGYVGLWLIVDEAQITNIAVHPKYRGHKIGEKLFGFAMQYAIGEGAGLLSLEVRVSNTVAQNLYRKFGLIEGGIRKGYYTDNGEDAVVMWVKLNE